MVMEHVEIDIPKSIVKYVVLQDEESQTMRNAMLLYPYIQKGGLSHGKAAELLGMHKLDLIRLYGSMGLPYIDLTEEEFQDEMDEVQKCVGMYK